MRTFLPLAVGASLLIAACTASTVPDVDNDASFSSPESAIETETGSFFGTGATFSSEEPLF